MLDSIQVVDFAARRARAREDMQPHLDEAEAIKTRAVDLKETLKARKKERAEPSMIEALEQEIKAREKAARDALAKAAAIDAAVFDLKAVNPNAAAKTDTRTPAEIIASIEAQSEIVSAAWSNLKKLLAEPD
jgi:type I restriction enzyme M protein